MNRIMMHTHIYAYMFVDINFQIVKQKADLCARTLQSNINTQMYMYKQKCNKCKFKFTLLYIFKCKQL